MYFLLSLTFMYEFFIKSFCKIQYSNSLIYSSDLSQFKKGLDKDLLVLEKKFVKDFLYKKSSHNFSSERERFSIICLDKESKILGYKKKFDCTEQKLFLPCSENKKFLKSTIFGVIKLTNS